MTESQLKQDLRAVRVLFSGPEKWTKRVFARNVEGNLVTYNAATACQWCLLGAILCCASDKCGTIEFLQGFVRPAVTFDDESEDDEPEQALAAWNDDDKRTFEDITALLDKAIEDAP